MILWHVFLSFFKASTCLTFGNFTLRTLSTQNAGQPGKDVFTNVPCRSVYKNHPQLAREWR